MRKRGPAATSLGSGGAMLPVEGRPGRGEHGEVRDRQVFPVDEMEREVRGVLRDGRDRRGDDRTPDRSIPFEPERLLYPHGACTPH